LAAGAERGDFRMRGGIVWLAPSAMILSPLTSTAPTGTSPASPAVRANAMARRM
jgi:hypothetical protein